MSLDVYLQCGKLTCYEANITHNLGKMAAEAGIYKCLWRPGQVGVTRASQLSSYLEPGIGLLEQDPHRFKEWDDPDGWGTYEQFLPWLKNLLQACKDAPDATVVVSV